MELVWIIKYGADKGTGEEFKRKVKRRMLASKEFKWTEEKNIAFEEIKQAIVNKAIAASDPNA